MLQYQIQERVKIKWSPNFAYAIGLITSDGNLSPDKRHMQLKSADWELVKKLKIALGIKNQIKSIRGTARKHYYIQWGDVAFYRFLNTIGLMPAKSKTIKKVTVPNEFFADFLRGLFDGDGTFYSSWDTRWPNSFVYQISFASASPYFIKWLHTRLNRLYNVKGFIRKGDNVFNLRYVKGDSKRLFETMYNKKNALFLKRKYNKIKIALEKDKRLRLS